MPECEVTSKTYHQFEVIPGAVRALGEMELRQKAHGFYMTALDVAMLAEHPLGVAQPMTLIAEAENVRVTKKAGETWIAGDWIYWHEATSNFSNIPASDLYCVGKAQRAAANDALLGFITMQDNYFPVQIGTAAVPVSVLASTPPLVVQTTSAVVAGTIRSAIIRQVQTAGAVAGLDASVLRVELESDVKIPNANALMAQLDFQADGCCQGLAAAACAELKMGTLARTSGSYGVLELELGAYGSGFGNCRTAFIFASAWGSVQGKTGFDVDGYFLVLGCEAEGAGVGKFCNTDINSVDGGMRMNINGADRWLCYSNG